ncbi:MAG: aldo/keto reductase [Gammaproteobacteria bacterium]|nr:aldo/keto reductase [Gammaproteobacteria bacterium]
MEFLLNNGLEMPAPGFGTGAVRAWQADDDGVAQVIATAIGLGYRHLDTASIYGNERSVGKAIKSAGQPRDQLFVVTKAWNTEHGYDQILHAFDRSQRRLDLEYLDLYLLHWPVPTLIQESWRAMERLLSEQKVRAIGVSNYRISDLKCLLERAEVVPACNQIELHPYFTQPEIREFCQAREIQIVSYSPLGTGSWSGVLKENKPVTDPLIMQIAKRHRISPAQVILRWNLQHGWVPIPKSENPERMAQNLELDEFTLSEAELAVLDDLETGTGFNMDPEEAIEANMAMSVPD